AVVRVVVRRLHGAGLEPVADDHAGAEAADAAGRRARRERADGGQRDLGQVIDQHAGGGGGQHIGVLAGAILGRLGLQRGEAVGQAGEDRVVGGGGQGGGRREAGERRQGQQQAPVGDGGGLRRHAASCAAGVRRLADACGGRFLR